MVARGAQLGMALLIFAVLGGCATQPRLNYRPQPASLEYRFGEAASAQVLARTAGVRVRGEGDARQPIMIVQLRVTNRSEQPLQINADDIELVAANLRRFPTPSLSPQTPVVVAPNDSQLVTATFLFPPNVEPDQDDLERVHLAVTLRQDGQPVTRSVMFQDIEYYRYYGYDRPYPPRWRTHIGVFGEI